MRVKSACYVFSVATMAMIAAGASAFTADGDPGSDIRGSLGASLGDLSLDNGIGVWAFALNAAFALAFVIAARVMMRPAPRQPAAGVLKWRWFNHVPFLALLDAIRTPLRSRGSLRRR